MGHKEEAEAFAKIVCPKGAQVLSMDLPGHGARQGRNEELNPWTAVTELQAVMDWANVTEQELSEKGEIATSFGQTLSWAYLRYVREYPVHDWQCPICILYAGQDNMTSRQTVEEFTLQHGAQLTIMDNGEHWFHTPEQREVLQAWEASHT